ncbi:MAG: toll/interleukin-1 receptor domain-containing protein [Mogibacterium sp.]|nr:toll/interleukin-1 receptor domain-containing protein [Mogibacterium sp.]
MNHDLGSILNYKTRGGASPQGRPRVYFCCHEEDFGKYFDRITDEILDIQRNAAIWYRDPDMSFPDTEEFLEDLALMQLFVVPVTSNFLFTDDPARTVEFEFAEEHHIPVLPLMQESGLAEHFGMICGDLQFLDERAARTDSTALPYRDKLKRFLGSVLVDDKTAERIRSAFDAYIFLSYRKKDRAAAQKVMNRIHQIKACRDMAIWYDEFLTPGEDFNDEIREAMRKSELFTLVVTPNLLEQGNYVQTTEYPAAQDMGMKTLPVETAETDQGDLRQMYENIGQCFPLSDPVAIAMRLKELLKDVVLGTKRNDPEHKFLMGLAYLSGVDVEINQGLAVSLIAEAAEDGKLPEAYEKMVDMFRTGDAVERDFDEAIAWQEEYADVLAEKAEAEQTGQAYQDYFTALAYLEQYQADQDESEDAYDTAMRLQEAAERVRAFGHEKALWDLSVAYERLGDICYDNGDMDEARDWYEQALEAREEIAAQEGTPEAESDLGFSYSRMGDICRAEGRHDEALEWYNKELDIRLMAEGDAARKPLADTYNKIGDVYGEAGNWDEARNWYHKDVEISKALYEETGTAEATQDLGVAYGRLGFASQKEGNTYEARHWYEKDIELCRQAYYEAETLETLWNLAVVYEYMADLCVAESKASSGIAGSRGDHSSVGSKADQSGAKSKLEEAREWYFQCEDKWDDICEMTETIESMRNRAGICLKLGDLYVLMGKNDFAKEWYDQNRAYILQIAAAEAEDAEAEDEEEDEAEGVEGSGEDEGEGGGDEGEGSEGDGGVSILTMENLAVNCYKLGTLDTLPAAERKHYLEDMYRIGTALYRATGAPQHANYILAAQHELAELR